MDVLALHVEELPAIGFIPPGRVVFARTLHVGGEQRVKAEFAPQRRVQDFQPRVHQQNRRVRVYNYFFDEAIAALAV